jgi:hypothetical protein
MKMSYKKVVKDFVSRNWRDLIIIFMIPVALFLLFLLPNNLKEMLVLHKDYSNVYDIFTTNFIHKEFNHLIGNVIVYIGAILLLYFLLLALNKKDLFYKLFIVNLSIVPVLISLIWIPVNRFIWTGPPESLGFSGIVSSICGMVVYAYILLLHEKIKINTFYVYLSSIFLIPLLFTLIYFTFTTGMLMTVIFLTIGFLLTTYNTVRTIDKKAVAILFILYLYLIITLFSSLLFPFLKGGDVKINFFIHYIGFIIGMTISFVIHSIYPSKFKFNKLFSSIIFKITFFKAIIYRRG